MLGYEPCNYLPLGYNTKAGKAAAENAAGIQYGGYQTMQPQQCGGYENMQPWMCSWSFFFPTKCSLLFTHRFTAAIQISM